MSNRAIYWYTEPLSRVDIVTLKASLSNGGLKLARPDVGVVSRLDQDGFPVEISDDALIDALASVQNDDEYGITFQWVVESCHECVCQFRPVKQGVICQTYYLDGLDRDEHRSFSPSCGAVTCLSSRGRWRSLRIRRRLGGPRH